MSYNSCEGIESYLTSLAGLNRLVRDRRDAHKRGEKLNEFFVLNRWYLDSVGNFCRTRLEMNYTPFPKALLPKEPVLERDEFWARFPKANTSTNLMHHGLPPENVKCPHCGSGWTVESAHDSKWEDAREVLDGAPYVGLTLKEAVDKFATSERARTDAKYFCSYEAYIYNTKYIDLTPHKYDPSEPQNKHGMKCVKPGHVIEDGDRFEVCYFTYTHTRCAQLVNEAKTREFYSEIVKAAGFKSAVLDPIPNEYYNRSPKGSIGVLLVEGKPAKTYATLAEAEEATEGVTQMRFEAVEATYGLQLGDEPSWVNIRLPKGTIKMGWRKRVLNIDWSDYAGGKDLLNLFENEDVTKGPTYIHAWGKAKAVEYLSKIREATTS